MCWVQSPDLLPVEGNGMTSLSAEDSADVLQNKEDRSLSSSVLKLISRSSQNQWCTSLTWKWTSVFRTAWEELCKNSYDSWTLQQCKLFCHRLSLRTVIWADLMCVGSFTGPLFYHKFHFMQAKFSLLANVTQILGRETSACKLAVTVFHQI